jgi:hypothetical protein
LSPLNTGPFRKWAADLGEVGKRLFGHRPLLGDADVLADDLSRR